MTHARTLAAAQSIPSRGDVDANVEQHARLVHAAAREQAQVLVFPELSLTGYEPELAADLAFTEADARLDPIIDLASTHGLTLIVGAPVRLASGLHIGAFLVFPDRTLELYTKRHLGEGEETVFQPAERDPLVPIGKTSAAVAVCADANHASHPKEAANRGASTYLVSTLVTPSELPVKTANLRDYAVRHSLTVVFSNYGGPSGGLAAGGGSAIWSDQGELLAQLDWLGTGIVVARETETGWRAKSVELGDA